MIFPSLYSVYGHEVPLFSQNILYLNIGAPIFVVIIFVALYSVYKMKEHDNEIL